MDERTRELLRQAAEWLATCSIAIKSLQTEEEYKKSKGELAKLDKLINNISKHLKETTNV